MADAATLSGFIETHAEALTEHLPNGRRALRQLIAFRLGTSEAALLAWPDRPLTPDELSRLDEDVAHLSAGGPLAHLYGEHPFLDWDFHCDGRALIPRPETEALVARLFQYYDGRTAPLRILDLCCGSGVMGLALALRFPNAHVWLSDLCPQALSLCRENRTRHHLEARTTICRGDLWHAVSEADFDLVVANPPYVAEDDEVGPSVLDFEPHLALYSRDKGMDHIKRILTDLPARLKPDGLAAFELGHEHHQALSPWLAALADGTHFRFEEDPYGVPRYLFATRQP